MKDGTLLLYICEDGGRVLDTGTYLAPGAENVVEVGRHVSSEVADALVQRGICTVYEPAASGLRSETVFVTDLISG